MARTSISTSRSSLGSSRSVTASRSSASSYFVPIDFVDMGIKHLWDFRTGKSGANSSTVMDMIGNLPMNYLGATAISSVYTSGQYSADLERGSSDYFSSNPRRVLGGSTSLTLFAWVLLESIGTQRHILTQFEPSGNQRSFLIRLSSTNNLEVILSPNGTNQCTYTSTSTLTDTSNWHFIAFTYDTTNRGIFYLDDVTQTTTNSGGHPASLYDGNIALLLGATQPATPANFFDGKIGICGLANSAMSSTNLSRLYNITRTLMGV